MEGITLVLEVLGTVAFAISGAVMAIQKKADIFGVLFLAVTTATGGGLLRDIILGDVPPSMFLNSQYVYIALAVGVGVFVVARIWGEKFHQRTRQIDRINNVFDAMGLGVFTVMGMNTAISAGYIDNAFMVIFLGMLTGVGGGIIRDTFINEMPSVLRKQVYAVASIVGGIIYYEMIFFGCNTVLGVVSGISSIFIIRMMATRYEWHLPKAVK